MTWRLTRATAKEPPFNILILWSQGFDRKDGRLWGATEMKKPEKQPMLINGRARKWRRARYSENQRIFYSFISVNGIVLEL
jgi:hypothetical protein